MQEVYFEKIRSQIIPLLQNASHEVSIAMAWFTSAELFLELIKCLDRRVKVELVLLDSPINFMEYAPDFNEFIHAGGRLYIASSELGLMHHKFCVIDKEIAITGSYNWTYYAETRNMENILITDDVNIVSQFEKEFDRLITLLQISQEAPRYTWDSLENMDNVDFADINYEAEQISHILNKPVRKVMETKTQVFVTELENTPKAAYNIGLWAKNDDNAEVFEIFIPRNETLPYESREHSLFFNSKEHDKLINHIIYGESKSLSSSTLLLKEVDFNEVICGRISDSLELRYRMTLDINGDLKMEVSCKETGKRKTITLLNQKFVRYV